jgi:hypothetical protein
MPEKDDIRQRIEARITQGEFLANMLHVAGKQSHDVQDRFVEKLSAIARTVRGILDGNGLIRRFEYRPNQFWPYVKGKSFAFIDGGVASIDLPSAAPVGIRVGSYIVKPGDETEAREKFNIELALVDDLYSDDGVLYDDEFDDIAKLRDAARMIAETAAAYRLACLPLAERPDAIILHGPLVNPVSPYGLDGFPAFGLNACRTFLQDQSWAGDDDDRQFLSVYLRLLEQLKQTGVPVFGAVERSIGRDPVVLKRILDRLQDDGLLKRDDAKLVRQEIETYGLNDASLLDVVLADGEYLKPLAIMRQGPESKWPDYWKEEIRDYPKPLTTYLKPSSLSLPFRIETFEGTSDVDLALELILHTSRLLPSYGFPVGLDIVDKFAKVPSWMSRGIKGQHQIVLLKKALESGDAATVAFAKRVLTAKGRDWFFRPTT